MNMKRKLLILCTLLALLGGALGVLVTQWHAPVVVHASGGTTIFQDNFDSYTPGPLPTGTGTNQWTAVKVAGTGFALAVSTTQSSSPPNSLQVTLGSGLKGHAWAIKNYTAGTGYAQHTTTFGLYLDSTLNLGGQPIPLFAAENHAQPTDGSVAVWLSAGKRIQLIRYDSTGKKHVTSTTSVLSLGQWYSIGIDQTNDAVSGSWSLFLNGTQIAGQTGVDTGNTLVDTVIAGDTLDSTVAQAGSFYLDDVLTSTSSTPPPPAIFQDNFDSYTPGPLPTGTGTNQWTAVKVAGTGFALAVSTTQSSSPPNSLQVTLGSGLKGYAWASKKYVKGYATHAVKFLLYLGGNLNQAGQSIALFAAENHTRAANGSTAMWLAANGHLQVVRYDSLGKKYVITTTSKLSLGQWYTLELDQTNNATAGSWSLFLNGTQIAGQTGVDTGNTLVDTVIAGDTQPTLNAMSGSFYLDDVLTSSQHIG